MSDYKGDYWPFRTITLEEAVEVNDRALIRTLNRCESFQISLSPGSRAGGPLDLYEKATSIGEDNMSADAVIPRPIVTGRGRQFQQLLDAYEAFDFKTAPKLILPITRPYKSAANIADKLFSPELDKMNGGHPWADEILRHPPGFALLNAGYLSVGNLSTVLLDVFDQMPGDVELHLSNVYPTVGLAALLRHHQNLVQSLSIAPEAIEAIALNLKTTTSESAAFSKKAKRDLQSSVEPGVALAAEFSFLCSQYVADDQFSEAATQSIIPFATEEAMPANVYDSSKAFSRQVPPDMVGSIGVTNNDLKATRGSCLSEFC
ncbi:hypothetical protein [Salinibaculum rarum]|uniref:hypothetical protein n=1 Tax=Salinibaculum rarum TaxID=3058903 RepID=UPI00265F952B|nr:hypothetical protein [Salinibaculum sp. KK48]